MDRGAILKDHLIELNKSMINSEGVEQVGDAQHPENAKSRFPARMENQSNGAKEESDAAQMCNLCNDGAPPNVSSGPDWARCDGCGLQAHLRCLGAGPARKARVMQESALDGEENCEMQGDQKLLCRVCFRAEPATHAGHHDKCSDVPLCRICGEDASSMPVLSLQTFASSETVNCEDIKSLAQNAGCDANLATMRMASFTQMLQKALSESNSAARALFTGPQLHAQCLASVIVTPNDWAKQLFESQPEAQVNLLLDQSFWQSIQFQAAQFPVNTTTSQKKAQQSKFSQQQLQKNQNAENGQDSDPVRANSSSAPLPTEHGTVPDHDKLEPGGDGPRNADRTALVQDAAGEDQDQMQPEEDPQTEVVAERPGSANEGTTLEYKCPHCGKVITEQDAMECEQKRSPSEQADGPDEHDQDEKTNFSCSYCQEIREALIMRKKTVSGKQQTQTSILDLLQVQKTTSNRNSESSKPPADDVQHSQQKIVHKLVNSAASSRRQPSHSQTQLSNMNVQANNANSNTKSLQNSAATATMSQAPNTASVNTIEVGSKRTRRPPVRGYEKYLGDEETKAPSQARNSSAGAGATASKRAKADNQIHVEIKKQASNNNQSLGSSVQPSLKTFINERQSIIEFGQNQQIKLNLTKTDELVQSAADKKSQILDPFSNPIINDIFKPIMAADKLNVLRKDKERFDIFLLPKDLKVFTKEKRDSLLEGYEDEERDQAFLEAENKAAVENDQGVAKVGDRLDAGDDGSFKSKQCSQDNNENNMGDEQDEAQQLPQQQMGADHLTEPKTITQQSSETVNPADAQHSLSRSSRPKRRKKAGTLSRQVSRRANPGAELSWIGNLASNRRIYDRVQQEARDEKLRQTQIRNDISRRNNKSGRPRAPATVLATRLNNQQSMQGNLGEVVAAASVGEHPLQEQELQEKQEQIEQKQGDQFEEDGKQKDEQDNDQIMKQLGQDEDLANHDSCSGIQVPQNSDVEMAGAEELKVVDCGVVVGDAPALLVQQSASSHSSAKANNKDDSNKHRVIDDEKKNCQTAKEAQSAAADGQKDNQSQNDQKYSNDNDVGELQHKQAEAEPVERKSGTQVAKEAANGVDANGPKQTQEYGDQNGIEEFWNWRTDMDEPFQFRDRSQIKTVDHLYTLYNLGYYHKLETLQADFQFLVEKVIRTRCKNKLAEEYLQRVLQQCMAHFDRKRSEYPAKWRPFFETKFRENALNPKVEHSWQKYPGAKRQYFTIDDYKVITCEDMGKLPDELKQRSLNSVYTPSKSNSDEYKQILTKMQTNKKSKCGESCACQDPSVELKHKLTQTELLVQSTFATDDKNSTSKSENLQNDFQCCFHLKVECGLDCGCNPDTCRNRQMTLKQQLVLGRDVEERTAWGMDSYTAFNLCTLRPRDIPPNLYSNFLEHRMMFAVQQQGELGYDIREALKYIMNSEPQYPSVGPDADQPLDQDHLRLWMDKDDPTQFSFLEKELARMILEAITSLQGENDPHFRIHSKGLGIFCNRKEGIPKNTLLVEYFGEIYSQWLWYEKQDILKQGQSKCILSKDLPDFYNITYERHIDDPDGYDVLTVDPILFGNFASRLSHSCNPNCETITKVKQDEGLYSIGMFSQKNIRFGQELCFNYCSFTESEEEYRSAACLCGSMICQGRFLNLAVAQKNQGLMKEYHTFVDRNLILYNAIVACSPGGEGLTGQDQELLDKFGIKDSVLKGIPLWLKKWAALICEFIQFEQDRYPILQRGKDSEINIAIELKNLKDSKISNIAITINKVVRILKSMNTDVPPIRKMREKEVFHALWGSKDSLKYQLIEVLNTMDRTEEVDTCFEFIQSVDVGGGGTDDCCWDQDQSPKDPGQLPNDKDQDAEMKNEEAVGDPQEEAKQQEASEQYFADKVQQVRNVLLFISQELRGVKSKKVAIQALCDNLVLYARTQTYFTPNDYVKTQGNWVHIRKCDVAGQATDSASLELAVQDQGKTVYKGRKEYQAHHIWGQLVGWYKQTVNNPNSSLSADRRGSLSMPDISSFIVSAKNQENLNSGRQTVKKKANRRKNSSDEKEEVMPTMGSSTRSRAPRAAAAATGTTPQSAKPAEVRPSYDIDGIYVVPEGKEMKVCYPHKKYQIRDQFLQHWEEFFSKNWDTCCHWSFKNKHKLYGSIGFESVLKAGKDRESRLKYFRSVVDELRGYQE